MFHRLIDVINMYRQSSEFKSAFGSADLNADLRGIEDGFPCRSEQWKTTNFVGNITLMKEE